MRQRARPQVVRIHGKPSELCTFHFLTDATCWEYTEEMYGVQLDLSAQWVWGSLPEKDRDAAVSCLEQFCAQKGFEWGSLPQRTSLARWRVCNLQRAANKFHRRRLGIGMHDPIRKVNPAANLCSGFAVYQNTYTGVRFWYCEPFREFRCSDTCSGK